MSAPFSSPSAADTRAGFVPPIIAGESGDPTCREADARGLALLSSLTCSLDTLQAAIGRGLPLAIGELEPHARQLAELVDGGAVTVGVRGAGADDAVADRPLTEAESRQWAFAGLVGRSPRFGRMLRELRALQGCPRTTVLITGESGTGKELVARAIHFGGAQASAPFVRVDCSSLPAEQAEALLFGQARGAGPGANPERRGSCELAEGGTLFFDEVGDLPPSLQARLLRVLEDRAYQPLGAHSPRTLNARVIAATHADLPALVAAGRFRQDLYYRLMHYHLALPALRERLEDVPALARHFVRTLSADLKRAAPRLSPAALQRLLSHPYPGNVRELKNTLERAIIFADRTDELAAAHIVFAPGAGAATCAAAADPSPAATAFQTTAGAGELSRKFLSDLPLNLSAAEDILIARAIAVAEGNMSRAARLLGINRASLYRWQERRASASTAATRAA